MLASSGCFGLWKRWERERERGREEEEEGSYLRVRYAGDAGAVVRVEPHLDPLLARGRHVALHHALAIFLSRHSAFGCDVLLG